MRNYEIYGVGGVWIENAAPRHITNIQNILVNDQFQGCGVATALMKLVMRDADIEQQELWMVSIHMDSQHWTNQWYERLGFEPSGGYYIRKPNPNGVQLPEGANTALAIEHGLDIDTNKDLVVLSERWMDSRLEEVLRNMGIDPPEVMRSARSHFTKHSDKSSGAYGGKVPGTPGT